MKQLRQAKLLTVLVLMVFILTGCAHMMSAIDNADLQAQVKMLQPILLDPVTKGKNKTVFVEVNNVSQMQIDPQQIKQLIENKLTEKGYKIVSDPSEAGYTILATVSYTDYGRKTGTQEGGATGGILGALGGALLGNSRDTSIGLGLAGALVGSIGGALAGKAVKIETYAGVVDVQIQEKTENPVVGKIVTNANQGTATTIQTEQQVNTDRQIYRTQIAFTLKQTNIDELEAANVVAEKVATQIANLF